MINRRHFTLALAAIPFAVARRRASPVIPRQANPLRRAVSGGRLDRCRCTPHRRAPVARIRPAGLRREQVRRQWHHRSRGCCQERAGRLHRSRYHRYGRKQSARVPYQHRSFQGSVADYPGVASTHRAGGSPLARRKFARRIDRAGKETAGPCHTRPAADSGRRSTWLCNGSRRSPASDSSRCPIAAAGRRSTICSVATSSLGRSDRHR